MGWYNFRSCIPAHLASDGHSSFEPKASQSISTVDSSTWSTLNLRLSSMTSLRYNNHNEDDS